MLTTLPFLIIIIATAIVVISGTPNRSRREPSRSQFVSQTSSVTEAPSDEVEQEGDDDAEPARLTT